MINILVPIVESPQEFLKFIQSKKSKNYKFFVGIKENLAKDFKISSKNVEIHVYKNNSNKEQIINSLQSCNLVEGKIMILRRVPTDYEFDALENSNKDIVTLKARRSRFSSAVKNFVAKIIKKIFAFNFFEDISAICYGQNMYQLLCVCQNLSIASRINKYVGVEIDEIETQTKSVKKQYNRFANAFNFILMNLLLLASIAGVVCLFVFAKMTMLYGILAVMGLVFITIVYLISLMNFLRTLAVGKIHFGRAEEILI